jgi:competence protein ComEC
MKLPAVWIATAFAAGIAFEGASPTKPLVWLFLALFAMALGFICLWRPTRLRAAWILALLAWFALGSLAAGIERRATPRNNVARLVAAGALDTSEPLRWRGQLRSDTMRLPWGVRYEIDLDQVEAAQRTLPVTGGLRLSYFRNAKAEEALPPLRAGDRVEALARARIPRNFLDPGAFDERGLLARQNIELTGTLRSAELLRKLGTPHLTLAHRLARLRGNFLERLDALFARTPERAAVLRAMLLGDRTFVDSDLATTFQKTSAYHVLVVAGLHVAALAIFVVWLGRRLRLSLGATTLVTLAVLAAYVGIVQDRPPILRAALMATIFLLSRLLFRRVELLNTVALAALILLLARPAFLGDPSFQLSFLAAGVIAGLAIPWIERSSSAYRAGLEHLGDVTRDGAHPPRVAQFRLDLRAAARWLAAHLPGRLSQRAPSLLSAPFRVGFRVWDVILLSTTIQFGVLPLLAVYFHRVSLTGPLSNVPAVLLTGLIVPLGFITLALSFIWSSLAALFAKILGALVGALLGCVGWLGRWPRGSYRIPGPPALLLTLFFAALALLVIAVRAARGSSNRLMRALEWAAVGALAFLAVLVATHPFASRLEKGKLEITILDVGQGDSIFAAFPDGHTMLIDGGGQPNEMRTGGYRTGIDIGEEVVAPYLWSRGLEKIDVVALTHAHHDHLDGLHAVLEDFSVGQLWVGRDVNTSAYAGLIAEAKGKGVPIVHHLRGESFNWDGVVGRVLWPPDSPPADSATNNDSLVLWLEDGHDRFLLPGDIEQKVEKELVADGDALTADFLKVPHHGSKTSSTDVFIAAVTPRTAVVSVGENNSFGHPSPLVVERYQERGVRLLRTDRDGAVTALADGHSIIIRTFASGQH